MFNWRRNRRWCVKQRAEVQSLDPHKIEGVPESNVNRDLFEGLLVTDVDGHPAPVLQKNGKTKISKSGPSICVKMRNGPTVQRVTAEDFVL